MELNRIAQVVDNRDPESLGRVKVRIFPEFETLEENALPWAEPMNEDDSCMPGENVGTFRIPEENSFIVVEIDSTWQEFHYSGRTPNRKREGVYQNIVNDLTGKVDVDATAPQPLHLMRSKDGVIAYHNTDTGEMGIVGKNGTFVSFDSDGNVVLGSNGKSKLTFDGTTLTFEGATNSGTIALFDSLKEILEKLLSHNHVAPNGPTTPAQESNGTPLSSLKSKLNEMEAK